MHNTDNGTEKIAGEVAQQNPASTGGGVQRVTAVATSGTGTTAASTPGVGAVAGGIKECAGCGKRITERYLLKALDLFWHEDCLKCGCCDCRLGEVGSTLYTKANLILCKRDYLRLFGTTGYCAACNKVIPAFEMVMRAKSNVYHLECFACQQCNHRFCVGDRFYLCDNKILCEYDYEERLVFANLAYTPTGLAHIRRQVGTLQPARNNLGRLYESTVDSSLNHIALTKAGNLPPLPPAQFPPMLREETSRGFPSPDTQPFDAATAAAQCA